MMAEFTMEESRDFNKIIVAASAGKWLSVKTLPWIAEGDD